MTAALQQDKSPGGAAERTQGKSSLSTPLIFSSESGEYSYSLAKLGCGLLPVPDSTTERSKSSHGDDERL